MAGGGNQGSPGNPGSAANPVLSAGIGGAAAQQAQTPQWQRGVQLGNQIARSGLQLAATGQQPMQAPMAPRPMMQQGQLGGVPSAVVPGAAGMAPLMGGGLTGINMGMPQGQMPGMNLGQQPQINPMLLQMLIRARGGQ